MTEPYLKVEHFRQTDLCPTNGNLCDGLRSSAEHAAVNTQIAVQNKTLKRDDVSARTHRRLLSLVIDD
jgi:hypothetical protein